MCIIYILLLEKNKYYIGKSQNIVSRIENHFASNGSQWTKKYKPLKVVEFLYNCDDYDEDKYTIKYMKLYGINNVRGGSFSQIKLSDSNIITLHQIIKSVSDKCYICGNNDHFAIDCKKYNNEIEKIPIVNMNEKCDCPTSYFSPHRRSKCLLNKIISYFDDEYDDIDKLLQEKQPLQVIEKYCSRCGRNSHNVSTCYAVTHLNGEKIYS